jgi:hypothetical protein
MGASPNKTEEAAGEPGDNLLLRAEHISYIVLRTSYGFTGLFRLPDAAGNQSRFVIIYLL